MRKFFLVLVLLACVTVPTTASAAPILPAYDSFGTLAAATFGGSGIPNTAVAIGTNDSVVLGLSAAQRGNNTVVANDSAGTFFAAVGPDASTAPVANPNYATWNFNFYANEAASTAGTQFVLFYDFDPDYGTDSVNAGSLYLGTANIQNSWNLGMGFLDVPVSGVVMPPLFSSFNFSTPGYYEFMLQAIRGQEIMESVSIRVQVGDPRQTVPEPATIALLGFGLIAGFSRRNKQRH